MNTVPNFKRREESGKLTSFKTTVKDTRTRKTSDILDKRRPSDGFLKLGNPLPLSYAVKADNTPLDSVEKKKSTRHAWRREELRAFQQGRSEELPSMTLQERRERLLKIRQRLCTPVESRPEEPVREAIRKRETQIERDSTRIKSELEDKPKERAPTLLATKSQLGRLDETFGNTVKEIEESPQRGGEGRRWISSRRITDTILVLLLFCWWSYLVSD